MPNQAWTGTEDCRIINSNGTCLFRCNKLSDTLDELVLYPHLYPAGCKVQLAVELVTGWIWQDVPIA